MTLTIAQLKSKWIKEKNSYIRQEVGSGVQKFVKDILKSEEIFALKEGLISTPSENRKNEFTEESKTKAARQADIVIYINHEIAIPIEVERLGNIDVGLTQLLQYQLDLDKKYGILTDGQSWRFFNNSYLVKTFQLEEILEETSIFKTFWQEYIKPRKYYLDFFEEKGQLKILPEDLSVENRRQDFFRDITTLIKSFQNKLKIEGYFRDLEVKERKKIATEITYAYIIQFILYKTLVDNSFDTFAADFQERENNIFESLKSEQYGKILGIIDGISIQISQNIYRPFKKEQEVINEKLQELFHKPKNELHDVSPWLDIFVFIKKYNFGNVKNDIFGFIYENYLKELYQDTQKGQYFTDPAIVNFMLDQIGYTKENLQKRATNNPEDESISIIDPACGSGTFLYSATDRLINAVPDGTEQASKKIEELINENIFGLDIEEFPLYLAEMNILMRMLPLIINEKYNNPIDKKIKVFKTLDSIAEFIHSDLDNTFNDQSVAFEQQRLLFTKKKDLGYKSYMRVEEDLKEMIDDMSSVPRKKFDYVIGNPPYIGYNECCKQKILFFELMKQGRAKLNNVYGVNLHSVPSNPKKYRPNPNLYAFFVALGLALLKDNGKLCFILPQTFLVNPDFDVLRYHLAKYTTINKIITFSGKMFVGRGLKQKQPIATSSLIFVVSKSQSNRANEIDILHYTDPNDDIETCLQNIQKNKKLLKKKLKQDDLLVGLSSWNFIKKTKEEVDFIKEYRKITDDISIYYNHAWAEHHFKNRYYFDGGYSINEEKVISSPLDGELNYLYPKLDNNYFAIKRKIGFWPNIRDKNKNNFIQLRQGSQGYNFLDAKYKIIWSYNKTDRFYYTDQPVIWARNKYLGIASDDKIEITYLLSILNSSFIKFILNSIVMIEQESTRTILVSLQTIKNEIRVPKITEENKIIKDEIIKRTEEMLALEDVKLSDLVDFSGVLQQKFDGAVIVNQNVSLLNQGEKSIDCKIIGYKNLVSQTIDKAFENKKLFENKKIGLSTLKNLPTIDFDRQKNLKNYIDDLVFASYFDVPISRIGLAHATDIKKACQENKYYKIIEESVK